MDDELDRIEKQIDIDASAERVWALIAVPGWYINDGPIVEHKIEDRGDHVIVHDQTHGPFALRTEKLDPPRYAAFRWLPGSSASPHDALARLDAASTLVEFWVDDRPEGGVTLKVVESGFASLSESLEKRREMFRDNTSGWEIELESARKYLEGQ